MKQKMLLTAILISSLSWLTARATETEPNNDRASANTLALNGSDGGSIGAAADEDWWSVTTTGDGKLDVLITVSNGQYIRCYIYDNDGTTQLNYGQTNGGPTTVSTDGLATGTYYVRLLSYYSGGTPAYTISNTLTQPAQTNDVEPNGTRAQAKVLPLNGSRTGHVNYYYNLARDTADWYKVTLTGDGRLDLSLASGNGQYIYLYLYDNNGTTLINSGYSNGTANVNTDGLAAGTYYVKVLAYYGTGFIPYTLSNTFTAPSQANDAEPDSTRATALTLALNGSTTGHLGYYYNNHRDSADWYKVTTTADGQLRLTLASGNSQYIYLYLYDNNGTTLLNSGYSNGTAVVTTNGLAAGTYYVSIIPYYNNGYIPYTLSDSLFSPTQPNDTEPNDAYTQALTLAPTGSTTGHCGYYYNNVRDTADWYKIILTQDGNLNLSLNSNNGQYIYVTLYDNNGSTVLNSGYSNGAFNYNTDGLAAGTYYARVYMYYTSSGFAPYSLSSTFTTYANANDTEPNDYYSQAKTAPANGTVTGHIGFYQNGGTRNTTDIWKINYTGSGALTLNASLNNWISNGGAHYFYVQVYKDTTAGPIYSNYFFNASGDINLSSLTQGYYYIKLFMYYSNEFAAYSLTNTFTQVTKASIKPVGGDTATTCGGTNILAFKCSKSQPPYTVQLYRYGTAYGSARIVTNTGTFTFTGLPQGSYYATVYGDGATGAAFGKSPVQNLMPPVTGTLSTTNITQTSAKTNWTTITCAKFYVVQYHKSGDSAWLTKNSVGNVGSANLNGLTANTTYTWRVAAADSANKISATSKFTDSVSFTTATLYAAGSDEQSNISVSNGKQTASVMVYPNPASSQMKLSLGSTLSSTAVNAAIKDMNGNILWTMQNTMGSSLNAKTIDVSKWPAGMYMLIISGTNNQLIANQKVIISR